MQKGAVYEMRWRRVQEVKNDLRLNSIESRALWGEEAETAFRELHACTHKLWVAFVIDLEFTARGVREDPETIMARQSILWPTTAKPEDDQFMVELNEAIGRFEKLAKPHLVFERA